MLKTDLQFLGDRAFKYFLWFQGEANVASMRGYEDKFHSIVSAVSPDREPVVIVVGIWLEKKDTSKFRQLQQDMCNSHTNYYFVDSKGCPRIDGVHLSYKGQKMLTDRIEKRISMIETGVSE